MDNSEAKERDPQEINESKEEGSPEGKKENKNKVNGTGGNVEKQCEEQKENKPIDVQNKNEKLQGENVKDSEAKNESKEQEGKEAGGPKKTPDGSLPPKEIKKKKQNLDEISKEDLIKHVERLNKKTSTMSRRLELHEERYKTVSKSLEEKKSERDVLEKFVGLVLSGTPFEKKKDYEYSYLVSLWSGLEEKRDEAKRKMEMEYQESLEKKMTQNVDLAMKSQIEGLKRVIEGLETSNKRLSGEILELNGIIKSKNEEIVRLKKIEEQFLKSKAEKLLFDMEKANDFGYDDISERFQISDRLDQLIKTQNELEAAYEKIENLRDALKGAGEDGFEKTKEKGERTPLNDAQTQTDTKGETYKAKQFESSPFVQIQKPAVVQSPSFKSNAAPTRAEFKVLASDERYQLSIKYLKNVILKYFIYIASSNTKEAGMLMEVILDFLQVDHQERMLLENAKNKSNQKISDRNLLNNLVFWNK